MPQRERPSIDEDDEDEDDLPSVPASVLPKPSTTTPADDMPVYKQGTALVNGHMREVTDMTWTYDGDLVTLGDDSRARCWREGGGQAREFRKWQAGTNETWQCGWAEVEERWDEEDG